MAQDSVLDMEATSEYGRGDDKSHIMLALILRFVLLTMRPKEMVEIQWPRISTRYLK